MCIGINMLWQLILMSDDLIYWIVVIMTIISGFVLPSLLHELWEEFKKWENDK